MDNCSVLHVLLMIFIIPGWLGGDPIISRKQQEIRSSKASRGSHLRVRRGWIWSQIFVEEEDPTPRKIGQLKSDYDTGDFTIKYILSGEGAGEIFIIDEYTGDLHSLQCLDRELKSFYLLQAQAINRRSKQPVEPESEFIIKVQDINDNAPEFINEPYISSIPEMCPTGTTVIQVTATDADDPLFGNNAKLIYSILQGEPYFSVEPKTGIIVTSWSNMDREAREVYLVVVQVKDMLGLNGGYSATTTVTISLMDVNDNGPTFQHNLYTFAISESAPVGTTVGRIMADDSDVGLNAKMNYSLEDLEESSTFTIQTDPDTQEGIVILDQPLDFESKRRFVIAVEAINENIDTRFLSAYEFQDRTTLKITVTNVDEPPIFSETPYSWKVLESAQIGTQVGTIYARDTDTTNNPIRYSISKSSDTRQIFRIDPSNGTVCVANHLDRETAAWYNLTINAREIRDDQLSSSVSLLISVLDVNDNVPTLSQDYQPYVCEDTQAGELIELISATDADDPVDGHHFYFSMIPDKHINPNFTIRDNQVVIRDSGSPILSSTTTLTIRVCVCQPNGHCPSAGVEAQALALDLNMQILLGLSVCLITLAVLSTLILAVRKYKTLRQEKMATQELETEEFSEKILSFTVPETQSNQTVSLRHPHRRERKLCREQVTTSIRMSLRHSHLIGPEDGVFQQFIMDRLAEADEDPCVPPFDCLHTYAFEGTGSVSGSLSSLESEVTGSPSSLESDTSDPCVSQTRDSGPQLLRLSPWLGAADDDTLF
ncbi:cadherin-7 isoform X2 [Rhinichthys klamathensis goyatoka]|uniref:cadherin-7 isoform X2 n=1 Tax=Rhinichthys klamathensis goyatoka TaxID=3034132 RepID=UPI0024B61714|nr:cadherin-7 isoform X2 [Rhinichthys klamathensis goyatoka]